MEKTKYKDIFIYDFDDVNEIIVCGDIHGEFNALVNKVCVSNTIFTIPSSSSLVTAVSVSNVSVITTIFTKEIENVLRNTTTISL